MPRKRVTVGGVTFDALTEDRVVGHVRDALARGQGGRILTPNVDILRQIDHDPDARRALDDSTLVVADGMPVIWASRLAGTPLPERVAGSDLIMSLSCGLGCDGRSIFLLGGAPAPVTHRRANTSSAYRVPVQAQSNRFRGTGGSRRNERTFDSGHHRNERPAPTGASRAAAALRARCPGLTVAGAISPPYGFDRDPAKLAAIRNEIVATAPDLVLVGIGFPRQERLIAALRADLPRSWFLGCGMAIGFVAGEQRRAPMWMRRSGVEWMHRLATEPGRLAERYLRNDLPFAMSLLTRTVVERYRRPPRHAL